MAAKDSLPVPPAALKEHASFELLRVWVAGEQQHVSLRSAVWDDPFAWGIMLADLAQHIVKAETGNRPDVDRHGFLGELLKGFQAELEQPTGEPEGGLVQ